MDLGKPVKVTGTSVTDSRLGKMKAIAVGLAVQKYTYNSNEPDDGLKRKDPDDLVDWNDLCKLPSFTESRCRS